MIWQDRLRTNVRRAHKRGAGVSHSALRDADIAFEADGDRDQAAPGELARLLARIWRRSAGLSEESTRWLLDTMANQRLGQRSMPGRLPPDVRVMHKTGALGGRTIDIGIVELPRSGPGADKA